MKRILMLLALCPTALLAVGCGQEEAARITSRPAPDADAPDVSGAGGTTAAGKVTETVNAAGYTYVQVDTGGESVWAAAPEVQVKVGDAVMIPEGMPMREYHSKTLDRTFELVYFVDSILDSTGHPLPKGVKTPAGHPPTAGASTPPQIDLSGIERAEGGKTIGELFAAKSDLSGKEVTVRGKVVKFNAQIMGKNWLHVQDGSGDAAAGTNDLTVTTDVPVKVGDTVLVSGPVVLDKDFGFGYKYDVIIEDAKVTVE